MNPVQPAPLRLDARRCAGHLRLSLRERSWQGTQGNWAGTGVGSSIDFQDHRPYLPGDDPRYIDWAAYARSGQTIMKLYREEVSPRVDLLLDTSRSMFFTSEKAAQSLRLFFFCMESALSIGASLRIYLLAGETLRPVANEQAADPAWMPEVAGSGGGIPALEKVPFRPNAMRLFISDLLYDTAPDPLLTQLTARKGSGVILAPFLSREAAPDWAGNMELRECESGRQRRQRVDAALLQRYRMAYDRHFQSWQERSRRMQVRLARVACGKDLASALEGESVAQGVVETWG